MSTLGTLVTARREELGKTYRTMADESGLSLSLLHKIAKGELHQFPSPRTVEGLAAALELPQKAIISAAGVDVGSHEFVMSDEADLQALYYGAAELSPRDRKLLIAMAERLREAVVDSQNTPVEQGLA